MKKGTYRYINADDLIDKILKFSINTDDFYGMGYSDALTAVEDLVSDLPSKEFSEQKRFQKLRDCFIKRMTVDSETQDRRRKDYNQAIFCDYGRGEHDQVFCGTTMEMVLDCFDNAVKDLEEK